MKKSFVVLLLALASVTACAATSSGFVPPLWIVSALDNTGYFKSIVVGGGYSSANPFPTGVDGGFDVDSLGNVRTNGNYLGKNGTFSGTVQAATLTSTGAGSVAGYFNAGGALITPGFLHAASATLDNPLPIASGGTGATTAENARVALGLRLGADVQPYSEYLNALAGPWVSPPAVPVKSSTGLGFQQATAYVLSLFTATDAAAFRSSVGIGTIGTQNYNNVGITGGTITGLTAPLPLASGGTGTTSVNGIKTALGLGTMAYQSGDNVSITGGSVTGLSSAIPVTSGGTGVTSISALRTALGVPAPDVSALPNASSANVTGYTLIYGPTTWTAGSLTSLTGTLGQMIVIRGRGHGFQVANSTGIKLKGTAPWAGTLDAQLCLVCWDDAWVECWRN